MVKATYKSDLPWSAIFSVMVYCANYGEGAKFCTSEADIIVDQ